jgi:hypothetical protein
MSRGPRGAAASAPSLRPPLYQQAIFPSAFRLQVGWSAQEPPFKFFPVVPGIPDQLSRRTHPFLPLIRRKEGGEEDCGVLYDVFGLKGVTGYGATVFMVNVFLLPPTEPELLAMLREVYDSAEEIFAAGWRIE